MTSTDDRGPLAYVFWHTPNGAMAVDEYEGHLAQFHTALADTPIDGFGPTVALSVPAVPWMEDAAGYEHWCLLPSLGDLAALKHAAHTGAAARPHWAGARASTARVAAVMGHLAGTPYPEEIGWHAWFGRPDDVSIGPFHTALRELAAQRPGAVSVWRYELALGPSEYCVLADRALDLAWPAHAQDVRAVAATRQPKAAVSAAP